MGVSQTLSVTQLSQNITNNTSVVRITLASTQSGTSYNGNTLTGYYWVSINDGTATQYTFATTLPKNSTVTCFSVDLTVNHKADGTGKIVVSTSLATGISAGTVTTNKSLTLSTIPRATTPTLSASTIDMASTLTINLPRASSNFTHKLWYLMEGLGWQVIASGVGTSYSWIVPLELANQIPNATSGTVTISVETYNGSTLIGEKRASFTATVPNRIVPIISGISITDPTGYATTYGSMVQQRSKVRVEVAASGAYSSTVKKVSITTNGVTSTLNPYTSGVITASGSQELSVTVTDSRGRTTTSIYTYDVLSYSNPVISVMKGVRCLADGTENQDGAYAKITMAGAITSLKSLNAKTFKLEYKLSTATAWTTLATYSTYTLDTTKIVACNIDNIYNFRLTATDAFTSTVYAIDIGTVYTLMDFNASGKGIAFGKVSTQDGFDCNMPAVFRESVKAASLETEAGRNVDTMLGFIKVGSYTGNTTCTIPDDVWNKAKEFHIEATLTSSDNAWLLQNIPNLWGSATMKVSMSEYYGTTYFQNIRFLYGNKQIVPQQGWITGKYGSTTLSVSNLSYSVYYR